MGRFSWRGINKQGNNCKGTMSVDSVQDLKEKLLSQNIALLSYKAGSRFNLNNISTIIVVPIISGKIKAIEIINFFQNLSILLESGINLLQSISLVRQQTKSNKFKNIISQIELDVGDGLPFADSLQKQSDIFSQFVVWMVRAGEKTGKLDFVLKQLTGFLFARFNLTKNLKQAAILPIITFSFALLIISGIFLFVVPQFETLFESVGKDLPQSTKLILKISNFLRSDYIVWWLLFFLFVFMVFYFVCKLRAIRILKDRFILKVYFLKNIILNFDLICFLSVLSLSLKSGIPLTEALNNSLNVAKNFIFKQKIVRLAELVSQGESFAESLQLVGTNFFPESLIVAVSVGEQSGNLDLMLEKQSEFFKKELESNLYVVTTVLQPVLMIVIGILIALLMLSVYLPIFDMANMF